MEKVTRIGVSLEPDLLHGFDEFVDKKGYATRSEAIRDLIREALVSELVRSDETKVVGTITLVYEHHRGQVKERLMDIQHAHHDIISSSVHVHLDLEKCLEVLVVNGTVAQVKQLSDELTTVRGVLHGLPVMLTGELHHHKEEGDGHAHPD
jgi:CopG family nickel-responsive transcriptional regulator